MQQIRFGLEAGLDVSIYAEFDISAEEMQAERIQLLKEKEVLDTLKTWSSEQCEFAFGVLSSRQKEAENECER